MRIVTVEDLNDTTITLLDSNYYDEMTLKVSAKGDTKHEAIAKLLERLDELDEEIKVYKDRISAL